MVLSLLYRGRNSCSNNGGQAIVVTVVIWSWDQSAGLDFSYKTTQLSRKIAIRLLKPFR